MQPKKRSVMIVIRHGQKLNRRLRSNWPRWMVGDKIIAPDQPMLVRTVSRIDISHHCSSSHEIIGQPVAVPAGRSQRVLGALLSSFLWTPQTSIAPRLARCLLLFSCLEMGQLSSDSVVEQA